MIKGLIALFLLQFSTKVSSSISFTNNDNKLFESQDSITASPILPTKFQSSDSQSLFILELRSFSTTKEYEEINKLRHASAKSWSKFLKLENLKNAFANSNVPMLLAQRYLQLLRDGLFKDGEKNLISEGEYLWLVKNGYSDVVLGLLFSSSLPTKLPDIFQLIKAATKSKEEIFFKLIILNSDQPLAKHIMGYFEFWISACKVGGSFISKISDHLNINQLLELKRIINMHLEGQCLGFQINHFHCNLEDSKYFTKDNLSGAEKIAMENARKEIQHLV